MKQLLFFLCIFSSSFLMAQDCTRHLLMQKGVQLEYKVYFPAGPDSGNYRSVSRLVFKVEGVKDSARGTWSTIVKNNFSIYNPKDHFERKFVLQCDGKNIRFPYDFFLTDILYLRDVFTNVLTVNNKEKHGFFMAFMPLEDVIAFIVPLVMDGVDKLPDGKKQFVLTTRNGDRPFPVCGNRPFVDHSIDIRSINFENKNLITTPAGSFECYKYCVKLTRDDDSYVRKFWLYFNKEIGLVKFEDPYRYLELNSISR